MDVRATLIAHFEAAEAVEPGERALHSPPESAQPLPRFDDAAGTQRGESALSLILSQRRSYPLGSPW
jgi:hypothetical protein